MYNETVSCPMVNCSFTQGEEDPCTENNLRKCENTTDCGRCFVKEKGREQASNTAQVKTLP